MEREDMEACTSLIALDGRCVLYSLDDEVVSDRPASVSHERVRLSETVFGEDVVEEVVERALGEVRN
jgi:hypothetical protein